jgi:Porin PorA
MRTSKIVLLVTGVLVLVAAAIWRPVVAPQLTKLPTSLDTTYQFTGTYTGYVNQTTGARLATPQNLPLSIVRQFKAVPAQSSSSELVVKDASTVAIGPIKSLSVAQYVLDRSTSKNVKSPYAYAVVPSNVASRPGSWTCSAASRPPPSLSASFLPARTPTSSPSS